MRSVIVRRRVTNGFQSRIDRRMASVASISRPFSSMFGSAVLCPQLAVR